MPVCSALAVCTASLMFTVGTSPSTAPDPTLTASDLTKQPWCYAARAGKDVESWKLKDDGTAEVVLHLKGGERLDRKMDGTTWTLKKRKLVIRIPRYKRRVLTIKEAEANRLHFANGKQAINCQPR